MRHEFIHLSQNDPRWQNAQLGLLPGATIGAYGCYLTAYTVLAHYFGHATDPVLLNSAFVTAHLFVGGDLVSSDDDLAKVFPDISFTTSLHYEDSPANLQVLKDLLSDPTCAIIVEIRLGPNSVHYTPVIDCDGTSVTIMNVWNGLEQDVKTVYGDPATQILKYVVYHGNPVSLDPFVCDRKSVRDRIIKKASNWDDIVNHGFVTKEALYDRLASLEAQNRLKDSQIATLHQLSVVEPSVTLATNSSVPTTVTNTSVTPVSPSVQAKKSFWQTDISDLFKLFVKGGRT